MLSRNYRLPRKLIEKTLKNGKYLSSLHFTLRYAYSSEYRFAFAVSKKVVPSAVLRNKLRRRGFNALRSILRAILPKTKMETKRGVWAVFFLKKESVRLKPDEFRFAIEEILHKAGVV